MPRAPTDLLSSLTTSFSRSNAMKPLAASATPENATVNSEPNILKTLYRLVFQGEGVQESGRQEVQQKNEAGICHREREVWKERQIKQSKTDGFVAIV